MTSWTLLLNFACLLVLATTLCLAKPTPRDRDAISKKPIRVRLTDDVKNKVRANCAGGKCKGQTQEAVERRQQTKKSLAELIALEHGHSEAEAEEAAERQLAKIQDVKRTWYRVNGLDDVVEPEDDGLWQGDIILSEEDADHLISHIESVGDIERPGPPSGRRLTRSASVFFEESPDKHWDSMPIHYWIHPDFKETDKVLIRAGLAAITDAASCITFEEDTEAATTGNQIQVRVGSCGGFASVGRASGPQSVNVKNCNTDKIFTGSVIHETIHALGGGHEHTRVDRDFYIKLLTDNIKETSMYNFDIQPQSTNYGVNYDFTSIMHYGSYYSSFAKDPSKPTIQSAGLYPFATNMIGTNSRLTDKDKLQLNRMYCVSPECVDINSFSCSHYAIEVNDMCHDPDYEDFLRENCPRSCGFCS